jgi:PPM family protein phosphatase
VLTCLPPEEAVQALIHIANLRGGPDNITVVVAKVLGPQVAQNAEKPAVQKPAAANAKPIHPMVWTILGVSALAAIGFFALGQMVIAFVALLTAIITAIMAIFQRQGDSREGWAIPGRRFGRGPYVTCDCAPNEAFINRLTNMMVQLRDAAASEGWQVDWYHFNQFISRAETARQAADFTASGREYLRAITFMMAQLKQQKPGE